MPVAFHDANFRGGEWGLWRIGESERTLRQRLSLFPAERAQLDLIKGEERRREFLAARLLLHQMSGRRERAELRKDASGKPHLVGSAYQVSISHTVGYSAAIAHPRACGIDVQRIVPRIRRLARKFVGPAEAAALAGRDEETELLHLHYLWSAKEALYKAYGIRALDFKNHLSVDIDAERGRVCKDGLDRRFALSFRDFGGFVLVGAIAS